jgi:hypothetical protein
MLNRLQVAAEPPQDRSDRREPEHDNQREPAQLEATQPPTIEPLERDPELQPEPHRVERDPYIEQAIQEERDRQQAFDRGIDNDRDNDRGVGIE